MCNKKTVLGIVGLALVVIKVLTFKVGPCSPEIEEQLRYDN